MPTTLLKKQCKALKLAHIPNCYQDVKYQNAGQYLTELFAEKLKERQARKVALLVRQARLPEHKTLADFDWTPVTLPSSTTISDLTKLKFLKPHENILALGAVGTGKTHLATALGLKACLSGKTVRFFRCLDLANELLDKYRTGDLSRFMKQMDKMDLLIIDELGFVPLCRDGAELLFNVVAGCYEHRSLIITSNLKFGEWNSVLGDSRLTAALIDRLVRHAHVLAFSGESFRLRNALSAIKEPVADVAAKT